jgi:predicted TIM-barrel fold metal-dependent hydrolase
MIIFTINNNPMNLRFIFLSTLALVLASGCNQEKSEANTAEPAAANETSADVSVPPFIIDAHVHYRPNDEWEQSFIEVYTRHNAMACLMVRMDDLERGIKFAKANPDRIIPYAMIDIDSPTILEDVKKVHAMGYKGLGEFFARNQWNYDDPKYDPLWKLAEELGMPLAPHTGNLSNGMMARLRPA